MTEKKHISLSELQAAVARALDGAFPVPVWVAAEIAELKVNGAGHCYMELVEKGGGSGAGGGFGGGAVPKAQARAVVWRSNWVSLSAYFRGVTGSSPEAGMKVLLKVVVSYHELYGFSLVVSDIDPSYTLGEAERARLETIARLQSDGVWDMNRSAGLPAVVQRVAVVSSSGAAGWRDFLQELGRYPYRFSVELFEAVMQGVATEDSVVAALEAIAERAEEFDAVVVIRGGGSASDLSAFNSYRLCAHIAQFPLPVVTGIGHDKDRSVADMVAALELKTPTAVAVWLGEGLTALSRLLDDFEERVSDVAAAILEHEKLRLERLARVFSAGAVEMTRGLERRLDRLASELVRRCGEFFLHEEYRLHALTRSFSSHVGPPKLLAQEAERLKSLERAVFLHRPENILSLGFAIVRTLPSPASGQEHAVHDASTLTDGQSLAVTFDKGKVVVTVNKNNYTKTYGEDI